MDEPAAPRYLSARALDALGLGATAVADSIESAIRQAERGRCWAAPKSVILPPDGRYVMSTLAVADDPPYLVSKSLVVQPDTPPGEPGIHASVTVSDARSGRPLAILDGDWVTAVRTAGLSVVAARRLASPDAAVLATIGCGVQARSHLRAFAELYPLRELRAFGRSRANVDALCALAHELGLEASSAASATEALEGADIVVSSVTLDPRLAPFVDAGALAPGSFASITDQAAPWLAEPLAALDTIVVDDAAQEREADAPLVDPGRVAGDLADLVTGRIRGRKRREDRCAFVFRGLSIGDLAVAGLACRRSES